MTTIRLYDNTRISGHRSCNRKYYFRHVRHLTGTGTAPALAFGAAWHKAMDTVWSGVLDGPTFDPGVVFTSAIATFNDELTAQLGTPFDNLDDEHKNLFNRAKRTPDIAKHMLARYIGERANFMRANFRLLSIEKPFIVPINPTQEILYCGRLDKVVEYAGGVWAIEHKTTGSGSGKNGFYRVWTEQWQPNSQVDGYLHALRMLYGNRAKGVLIDGALVHRTDSHFEYIPVDRQVDQLEAWHYDLTEELHRIDENKKALARSTPQDQVLRAYPKNTNSCTDYNQTCTFIAICRTIPNPLAMTDEQFTRDGRLKVEKWSPFDAAPLEQLGLTRQQTGET